MNIRRQSGSGLKIPLCIICLLILYVIVVSGCDQSDGRKLLSAAGSTSVPYEEQTGDPLALSTIKSVAVFPFANHAPEEGFDALGFSTRLANQLTSKGRLKIIYPKQVMAAVAFENRRIKQHNSDYRRRKSLGISLADERAGQLERARGRMEESVAGLEDKLLPEIDPVYQLKDAITIGRALKVDAVIVGAVTDFDPYMRPRISLSTSLVKTGTSDSAAAELAALTQWGISRRSSATMGRVWHRQQNFDSRDGNVGVGVYVHGLRHHTDHDPYSSDAYLRSISNYYDYIGLVLANALVEAREKSVEEAQRRAMETAKREKTDQNATRERLRQLVDPQVELPNADEVINNNLGDRRNKGWRPDYYNREHPDKEEILHPEYKKE